MPAKAPIDPTSNPKQQGATPAGFRFECPVCSSPRCIEFVPVAAYHILCGACLAVLVVTSSKPKSRPRTTVRPIIESDLARIDAGVRDALLEAKSRRLRSRIEAGELVWERTAAPTSSSRVPRARPRG